MKITRILLIVLISTLCYTSSAQEEKLKKSIYGAQLGLFGMELYNESRLSEEFVFRTTLSPGFAYRGGTQVRNVYVFYPILSFAPKWYYNLDERIEKNKNIYNNSANFLSFRLKYIPNWFVISNSKNLKLYSSLSIIPYWGFRRNFGSNFNFEFGVGLGMGFSFYENVNDPYLGLHLSFKVGYDFFRK